MKTLFGFLVVVLLNFPLSAQAGPCSHLFAELKEVNEVMWSCFTARRENPDENITCDDLVQISAWLGVKATRCTGEAYRGDEDLYY